MRRLLVVVLLGVLAVSGCAGPGAAPPPAGGAGYPVSVPDHFGTVTVPARPVRVVAMSWTDADLALAFGVTPVGIASTPDTPSGLEPWTAAALGTARPDLFDVANGDPLEHIAALRPDLILATRDYHLAQTYAQLSRIAPTLAYTDGPNSDAWPDSVHRVAAALGVAARGAATTSQITGLLAAQRTAHPQLDGKTFSYVVAPTPAGAYTVNSTADASARVLDTFGMRLTPGVRSLPTAGIPGRAQVSAENLTMLDADVVLAAGSPGSLADLARDPVFAGLGAVRRGAYLPLDFATASALAFPSPLSLRWAVTHVVPRLAQAAAHAS